MSKKDLPGAPIFFYNMKNKAEISISEDNCDKYILTNYLNGMRCKILVPKNINSYDIQFLA